MMLFQIHNQDISIRAEISDLNDLCKISSIYGDKRRFLQIILNFLSNAVKFTNHKGNIVLKIQIMGIQKIVPKIIYQTA